MKLEFRFPDEEETGRGIILGISTIFFCVFVVFPFVLAFVLAFLIWDADGTAGYLFRGFILHFLILCSVLIRKVK